MEGENWFGVLVPTGTPSAIVTLLNRVLGSTPKEFADRAAKARRSRLSAPIFVPVQQSAMSHGPGVLSGWLQRPVGGDIRTVSSPMAAVYRRRYQSGPRRVWIKARNPASIAVQRERSEMWNNEPQATCAR